MKKTYKIEVDCANCANLMEDAARKTAGVQSATVNFMTQKMIVEFARTRAEERDAGRLQGLQKGRAGLRNFPLSVAGRNALEAAADRAVTFHQRLND